MEDPELILYDDGGDAPVVSVGPSLSWSDQEIDIQTEYEFGGPEDEEPTLRQQVQLLERTILSLDRQRITLLPKYAAYQKNRVWLMAAHQTKAAMGPAFFRDFPMQEFTETLIRLRDEQSELAGHVATYQDIRERQAALTEVLHSMRMRA
jgi:hypothetical protein